MSKKFILYIFAIMGAIVFPLLLLSAIPNPTAPKVVYVDRPVVKTQYVYLNIVLHGLSINRIAEYLEAHNPGELDKMIWFYDQQVGNINVTKIIFNTCLKYQVPLSLGFATANQESGFKVKAVNYNPATSKRPESWDFGLFQLNTLSHPGMKKADLFNPTKNADQGLKELAQLTIRYNNSSNLALAGYNAGHNAVDTQRIPYRTTIHVFSVRETEQALDRDFCRLMIPLMKLDGLDLTHLD